MFWLKKFVRKSFVRNFDHMRYLTNNQEILRLFLQKTAALRAVVAPEHSFDGWRDHNKYTCQKNEEEKIQNGRTGHKIRFSRGEEQRKVSKRLY